MREILDIGPGSLALWATQGLAWLDADGWTPSSSPGWVRGLFGPGAPVLSSRRARVILAELSRMPTDGDVYVAVDAIAMLLAADESTSHDAMLDSVLRVCEYIQDLDADAREEYDHEPSDCRWQHENEGF